MVARVLFPWLPSWRNTIPSPPAGDHKGPPIHPSSALAPTEYPTPFREVDAYYSRLIRPRWMFGYPNDVVNINLEHSQRARIVTSSMALPRGRATRALRAETRRVHRDGSTRRSRKSVRWRGAHGAPIAQARGRS